MNKENIYYHIRERDNCSYDDIDVDIMMKEINSDIDTKLAEQTIVDNETDELIDVWTVEFSTNYTVQSLTRILEYYGMSKKRLKKDEIVQIIVLYENDPSNYEIVERRRRLWDNIIELSEDPYLNKYISF